jgi:hypothetical protein
MTVRLEIETQRRPERRERHFIDAQRSQERVRTHAGDRARAAGDYAALRATEQFVAGERDDIDAVADGFLHRALVRQAEFGEIDERAAAEILHGRNTGAPSESGELCGCDVRRETFDAVIRGMTAHEQRRLRRQRSFEIVQIDFIGRADFDERRAASFQNVR